MAAQLLSPLLTQRRRESAGQGVRAHLAPSREVGALREQRLIRSGFGMRAPRPVYRALEDIVCCASAAEHRMGDPAMPASEAGIASDSPRIVEQQPA